MTTEDTTADVRPSTDLVMRDPATDGWIDVAKEASWLAARMNATDFVPKGFRGKPAAVLGAILHGRELGLPPMTALAITDSIEGKPSINAQGLRGLVLAAGHDLEFVETSAARCVCRGRRRGTETWTTVVWTIDEAKLAGLVRTSQQGKPGPWMLYPRRMLQARASAELCSLVFPDVMHGMDTIEEVSDYTDDDTPTPTPAAPKTTKVRRTTSRLEQIDRLSDPAPPAAPAPDEIDVDPVPSSPQAATEPEIMDADIVIEDEPADAPRGEPTPIQAARVSSAQLKMLAVSWGRLGVTDEQRRGLTARLVGRDLAQGSTRDLTRREASRVLEWITQIQTPEQLTDAVAALLPDPDPEP